MATVLLALIALTSCAPDGGADLMPGSSSGKEVNSEFEVGDGEGEASLAPEAVVSVAGVDVDGLNATVGGFVTQSIREGADCLFTLAQGEQIVERETKAIFNRSGTSCGTIQIPIDELHRGTWKVTLSVDASEVEIEPGSATMEVP